ncbi:hypothetical protein HELRODRAFT_184191 [Helobdella robusta]|uniref:Uncharacterized protein n=1 Tax=Helobdella robusta TaxID=6412 RepID=T1FKQ8_HELRO|nr:hypothetical protein HELRODRAFT_184191 [Helobdella robusta]ESO05456.1 hypothetical protein HELRODRAFT_184191 [Helobdella robusta]
MKIFRFKAQSSQTCPSWTTDSLVLQRYTEGLRAGEVVKMSSIAIAVTRFECQQIPAYQLFHSPLIRVFMYNITDSLMAKDAWFGLAETWFDCTDIPSSKNFLLTTSTSSNSNSKKTSTSSTAPTTTSMMTSSDCDLKTPFSEDGSYLQPDFADVTNYLQINNNINSSNNNNTLQSLQ